MHDLVIAGGRLVATMDDERRELEGGWVAINGGTVAALGGGPPPGAAGARCHRLSRHTGPRQHPSPPVPEPHPRLPADDRQVACSAGCSRSIRCGRRSTPRRRTCRPGSGSPSWHSPAARRRPTTSISIRAAPVICWPPRSRPQRDLGMRFHPTRGSMSLSEKDGGLPPDDVVADDDEILAACEEAVSRHHDRSFGAMIRIALAPCSPFTVTESLMVRSAELAERLDVRLHTHFAENAEDDAYSLERFGCRPTDYLDRTGWLSDRTWLAHCVMPDAGRGRTPRRRPGRRRPLPVEQLDPVVRDRPDRRPARRRRERRAGGRRFVVGRLGEPVAGGSPGDAPRQAPRRRRRRDGADGVGIGHPRRCRVSRAPR